METKPERRVALPGPDKGGAWVSMGDKEYKVAPLNFKALRELAPMIGTLRDVRDGELPNPEQMDTLAKLAHAALRRNYPSITEDDVADLLDFGNFTNVLKAVMGVPSIKEKPPGEAMPQA